MARVTAIFGGTFDPIHNGHAGLARAVVEQGYANHVTFVPAKIPPHKRNKRISPGAVRLEMVKLAIQNDSRFSVSSWELERDAVSYTWHTAQHFQKIHGDNLRILIGMDSLLDVHTWYQCKELVETFQFIVYRRPNSPPPPVNQLTERFGAETADNLLCSIVDGPAFNVSSTEIRKRVAEGKDVKSLLPNAVTAYVTANHLYKETS